MCSMISGLFIGSNDGRPPQAYKEIIVSLRLDILDLCITGIRIAKTKAPISCAVAKSRFSHNEALLFAIKSFSVIFFHIFSFFVAI